MAGHRCHRILSPTSFLIICQLLNAIWYSHEKKDITLRKNVEGVSFFFFIRATISSEVNYNLINLKIMT